MRRLGVLALLVCGVPAACSSDPTRGYAALSTFPQEYRTIGVHIFENATFDREIEFELADALIKELQARTPYRVTRSNRADTILTGRIVDVDRERLSKSRVTGMGEEVVVSVTVDFEWRQQRSGEVLTAREAFAGHALFVPSAPTGEPIEQARFDAVQLLARDIVSELRRDW
jgi:hypothetical protein